MKDTCECRGNTPKRTASATGRGSGKDQEERQLKLGAWINNQRSRATTLSPQRAEQLSAIGMRWA
ncbi:helicase associated domain-containing protein [Streptomyces oryzae]|uniref:helicase associated domain-containing protein n=1 Tax=Streptomyces oryzae TaxID=1434886 RepID=UPI0027DDED9D|nr:helicase associated domain-containing protein [Streptomyces oryzae]